MCSSRLLFRMGHSRFIVRNMDPDTLDTSGPVCRVSSSSRVVPLARWFQAGASGRPSHCHRGVAAVVAPCYVAAQGRLEPHTTTLHASSRESRQCLPRDYKRLRSQSETLAWSSTLCSPTRYRSNPDVWVHSERDDEGPQGPGTTMWSWSSREHMRCPGPGRPQRRTRKNIVLHSGISERCPAGRRGAYPIIRDAFFAAMRGATLLTKPARYRALRYCDVRGFGVVTRGSALYGLVPTPSNRRGLTTAVSIASRMVRQVLFQTHPGQSEKKKHPEAIGGMFPSLLELGTCPSVV